MANDAPGTTDPITAALDAAVEISGIADAGIGGDGEPYDRQVIACCVAAFLRALPNLCVHLPGPRPLYSLHMLADEVRDAR